MAGNALVLGYQVATERPDGKFEVGVSYFVRDPDVNSGASKTYVASFVTQSTKPALAATTLRAGVASAVATDAAAGGYDLDPLTDVFFTS